MAGTEAVTETPGRVGQLKRLTYTHDAMIDLIIQEPTVTHSELAEVFGYSQNWIGRVVNSDAFVARLAERKGQLIDPQIARSLNERLSGVAIQSLTIISDKLNAEQSASYALDALGIATAGIAGNRKARSAV